MPGAKGWVAIRVLGQEYRVRGDDDPADLQRVAHLVDETMERLRERTGAVDSLDVAVMAAVNLGRDLLAERAVRRLDPSTGERVRRLTDRVEELLRDPAADSRPA